MMMMMTRNKDQKRLVRDRMEKTGESYTAARSVVVSRKAKKGDAATYAAPRAEWPALASMSDEKVKASTGRTWAQWVDTLDKAKAHEWPHKDIAKYIAEQYPAVSGWWCQTVTVGYERIRGLREVNQRRDGDYDANKSRTFNVAVSALYPMFKDARQRKKWLPEGLSKVRTSIENKSIRADWNDGTSVQFYFVSKGAAKCSVAIQHAKLKSKADIATRKAFWDERLGVLKDVLRAGA